MSLNDLGLALPFPPMEARAVASIPQGEQWQVRTEMGRLPLHRFS